MLWGTLTLAVATFVFPLLGLKNFGVLQIASVIITVIGFEIYWQLFNTTDELCQKGHLYYLFMLPIPTSWIFAQKTVFYTLNGAILAVSMIPMGKILLWNELNLAAISWTKLLLAIFSMSFFFACFLIMLASIAKKTEDVDHLFMRLLFPLWLIGGFQFTWLTLFKLNKFVACAALVSPYIYATEAARAAILGQVGFIPFPICICTLNFCGFAFAWIGYKRLQKKLELA